MSLPQPTAIIFDWDNTLVDTWPIIHRALHETFVEMGLEPWSVEKVKANVRKSMRDSFPEVFGPNWEEAAKRYQAHYRSRNLESLQSLSGAQSLLEHIAKRGVPMFVVSNKKGPNLRDEANALGWTHFFKRLTGADDASKDKPYKEPVLLAFDGFGIALDERVWFVGDSDIDLECAKNVGATPILYGEYALEQPEYTPTTYFGIPYARHAKTLAELQEWL